MDTGTLLAILAFGTMLGVIVFAMRSKKKVEDRRHDPEAHKPENKSTLAKDAPNH